MRSMRRSALQFSLAAMLGVVAGVALNIWLFRLGFIWGLVGLNITKHVAVAALCQALGVNRRAADRPASSALPGPHLVNEAP